MADTTLTTVTNQIRQEWGPVFDMELREKFILPGSRKDVASILPAFDVFLITSRTEGLPRALLESLAAGTKRHRLSRPYIIFCFLGI